MDNTTTTTTTEKKTIHDDLDTTKHGENDDNNVTNNESNISKNQDKIDKQIYETFRGNNNLLPENLNDFMQESVSIWHVLGLSETEYNDKYNKKI
jgi:hypothetical protein